VRKTATVLRIADAQLAARAFLCGDAPTLADVCIGVNAYRWFELPIERPDLPALRAWYDRLAQRQPYRDVVMIPIR
jgi:glutathione S-transferase